MHTLYRDITDRIYRITEGAKFFSVTILLLIFQSIWLACTAIYPLPFDEYMHVGIIRIYAQQWSPFIPVQPSEASLYGDITRTGSYLYHYLMSFPYRVLDIFIDGEMAMVISLRLINIAMVVGALILFRKLFAMWKIPKRVANVVFLLFVFTPIVPFVAAHVNYDNLILLLTPAVLIFGTRLIIDKGDVAWNGALFGILGLTGMLAKETFLLLYAVISAYVLWRLWGEHGLNFLHSLGRSVARNIRDVSFLAALFVLLILSGLFIERHGVNLLRHGTLIVRCEAVQPESVCEDFGPWYRNRENIRNKPAEPLYGNPVSFTQHWVSKTMRGFFVPFSHTPTQVVWDREPFGPIIVKGILPVGFLFSCLALIFGLGAIAMKGRDLWHDKPLRFALVVCIGYLMAVWAFNYQLYLRLGEAEAIQARYSYPILLLLFLLMVKSARDIITSRIMKAWAVAAILFLFVWGGGIAPWLIRADDTWRWQNHTVQSVNRSVQNVLRYTILH